MCEEETVHLLKPNVRTVHIYTAKLHYIFTLYNNYINAFNTPLMYMIITNIIDDLIYLLLYDMKLYTLP